MYMNTNKTILNLTISKFKQKIKSVEDFPTLEEFVQWGNKNRIFIVSAFNHLVYVMKKPSRQIFDFEIKK